jgi:hypothetical protein
LAQQHFSQDDLAHDQDCAERETECRQPKWTWHGRQWHYRERGADEKGE